MNESNVNNTTEKWTLISTILASSMVFIDSFAMNIVLPAIQTDLNISGKSILWIINAYSLFLSSLLLVGGSLGDLYGRKKIFIIGIVIFGVSSFLCGISPNDKLLIAARAFQGVGGALLVPGSLAIISAVIPSERRGKAFGTWSTFTMLTTIIGPAFGGWLAGLGLWRVIFFINIPFTVFVIATLIKVPENRNESAKKLDITGAILATLGLAGITYGFLEASDKGFEHVIIQLSLFAGIISIVAFIFVEMKSAHPMIPLKLFKSKAFSGINAMTLFLYAALSASLFFLPLNLIQVQDYPEEIAGLTLLPFAILVSGLSRFTGNFSDKYGPRIPLIVGPLFAGLGLLLLTFPGLTEGPKDFWITFFPGIVMLGIGMGIVVAPLTATVMAAVPEKNSGIASGVNNTMARTAGLLAVTVLGAIILITFRTALTLNVNDFNISDDKKTELINSAGDLAETKPPRNLTIEEVRQVKKIIKTSFIQSFDFIIYISVALTLLGSFISMMTVKKEICSGRQKVSNAEVRIKDAMCR
jgi:EmrB/QacA subfamily drug resistance transporter